MRVSMKIRYFVANTYRQLVMYLVLASCALLLYDAIYVKGSMLELIISASIGAIVILSLLHQYLSTVTIEVLSMVHYLEST